MKTLPAIVILFLSAFLFSGKSEAQILKKLEEKVKAKATQRADQKTDKAIDKGLDEVEDATKTKKEGDGDTKVKTDDSKVKVDGDQTKVKSPGDKTTVTTSQMTYSSKFDFVPGQNIIGVEDFSNTNVGDFPSRWNTNGTAEVVTLSTHPGKWLKISKEGVFTPDFIDLLPENFTLEFTVGVNNGFSSWPLALNIGNIEKRKTNFTDMAYYTSWRNGHGLRIELAPKANTDGFIKLQASSDGNYAIDNAVTSNSWDNQKKNMAYVALWKQSQRLRIYVNGEKVFDVPRAFESSGRYNIITFAHAGMNNDQDYFVIGDLRFAVGDPDTRGKLLSAGKLVTQGILFEVNSDKIKPQSEGVLREIGKILKDNPTVKVKIVGHTDSDGDEKANMDLSKRRAAAVKAYLAAHFSVSPDNMQVEGKGESEPYDKNTTAEAKASNRRVEFIKL